MALRVIGGPGASLTIRGTTVSVAEDAEALEQDGILYVHRPGHGGYVIALPGLDQDSIRAELARAGIPIIPSAQIWIGPPEVADRIDRKGGLGRAL